MEASILGISRLRIGTDGNGITTLVAFHGCSLRCRYCLNPSCLDSDATVRRMTPEDVMEELKKDELYYIATKGGVTFGGGEPLLRTAGTGTATYESFILLNYYDIIFVC